MHGRMPMKLSQLLRGRRQLLQRASLANSAYAYELLGSFAARIARARLQGHVVLKAADPDQEHFCATLTARDGHQSLIEEHFTDEDISDLADAIGYITDDDEVDVEFELQDFAETFLLPLRTALEHAGVIIDGETGSSRARSTSDPV